jgi:hypothetical protein
MPNTGRARERGRYSQPHHQMDSCRFDFVRVCRSMMTDDVGWPDAANAEVILGKEAVRLHCECQRSAQGRLGYASATSVENVIRSSALASVIQPRPVLAHRPFVLKPKSEFAAAEQFRRQRGAVEPLLLPAHELNEVPRLHPSKARPPTQPEPARHRCAGDQRCVAIPIGPDPLAERPPPTDDLLDRRRRTSKCLQRT